jgi:antitoxin (DNA-binding transcriptional repressor) of toxin-antitoxin stability system
MAKIPSIETINLCQAKAQLSQLVERAAGGEEMTIAKAGRPLARPCRCTSAGNRALGLFRSEISFGDDFDAPLPDTLAASFRRKDA